MEQGENVEANRGWHSILSQGQGQLLHRVRSANAKGGGGGVASGVAGTISTRVRRHNLSMFAIQPHRVLAKFSAYPVCN